MERAAQVIASGTTPGGQHREVWLLGGELHVLVTHFAKPNAFLRLGDVDPFHCLIDGGFLPYCQALGISLETPHGVGHNCFKMVPSAVMPFIQALQEFFVEHREHVKSGRTPHTWVKSWWEEAVNEIENQP